MAAGPVKSETDIDAQARDALAGLLSGNDPRRMIEGNDGGAVVTLNGGETWSSIYNQPTAQMFHAMQTKSQRLAKQDQSGCAPGETRPRRSHLSATTRSAGRTRIESVTRGRARKK